MHVASCVAAYFVDMRLVHYATLCVRGCAAGCVAVYVAMREMACHSERTEAVICSFQKLKIMSRQKINTASGCLFVFLSIRTLCVCVCFGGRGLCGRVKIFLRFFCQSERVKKKLWLGSKLEASIVVYCRLLLSIVIYCCLLSFID